MAGGVLRTFDNFASSFHTPHCLTFDTGLLELSIKGPLWANAHMPVHKFLQLK